MNAKKIILLCINNLQTGHSPSPDKWAHVGTNAQSEQREMYTPLLNLILFPQHVNIFIRVSILT